MAPIAVIPALLAGGTLVPHAAGGLIVHGSVGTAGYIAGTYLSTNTIIMLLGGSAFGAGTGAGILGSLFGSKILGAKQVVTPAVNISTVGTAALLNPFTLVLPLWGIVTFVGHELEKAQEKEFKKLIETIVEKAKSVPEGEEAEFTEKEAEFIEAILRDLANLEHEVEKTKFTYEEVYSLQSEILLKIKSASEGKEAQFTEKEEKYAFYLLKSHDPEIEETEFVRKMYQFSKSIYRNVKNPQNNVENFSIGICIRGLQRVAEKIAGEAKLDGSDLGNYVSQEKDNLLLNLASKWLVKPLTPKEVGLVRKMLRDELFNLRGV